MCGIFNGGMRYKHPISRTDKQILEIVVQMQRKQVEPDYFSICTCLVHLNDAKSAANDLLDLTKKGGDVPSLSKQANNSLI